MTGGDAAIEEVGGGEELEQRLAVEIEARDGDAIAGEGGVGVGIADGDEAVVEVEGLGEIAGAFEFRGDGDLQMGWLTFSGQYSWEKKKNSLSRLRLNLPGM